MTRPDSPVSRFRALHASGCFVMPNPWDRGSAHLLAGMGFPALATTSAGFAWSLGRPDSEAPLADVLAHLRTIAAATDLPVNADFEGGFAVAPEQVGANVSLAVATGVAGLSIEDSSRDPCRGLFETTLAVERIRAAREAIDVSGTGVLLTGRCEGFLVGQPHLDPTIARLVAYADAGAECLYAPGLRSLVEISEVVRALAPRPVNVLVGASFTTVAELAAIGVRRISVGGALARAAWTAAIGAASEIANQGTFGGFATIVPFATLDEKFRS